MAQGHDARAAAPTARAAAGGDVGVSVRPTQARIDTSALQHNMERVQQHVGATCRVLAVVKADAYGHGAATAARAFVQAGAWGLAVSLVEEGIELREAGIGAPVVVLGGVPPTAAEVIVHRRLTPVVWTTDHLEHLSAAVSRTGARPLPVHVKIDTGMSRLGVLPEDLTPLIDWLGRDRGQTLLLQGVMTHLASADDMLDELTTKRQLTSFEHCLQTFSARGLQPTFRHAANSAALVRFRSARFDMVRPGIALYGGGSCREVQMPNLRGAMTVRSRILALRKLPAGSRISYGGAHQLERDSLLAVVPVGYADGYPRNMSGKAQMLVRGHRCRVLGNITMDTSMLDVTEIPGVRIGEEVTLLGEHGPGHIDVFEVADWAGTIPYEVTCGISKRVPRYPG
jgi:alanine racemase